MEGARLHLAKGSRVVEVSFWSCSGLVRAVLQAIGVFISPILVIGHSESIRVDLLTKT